MGFSIQISSDKFLRKHWEEMMAVWHELDWLKIVILIEIVIFSFIPGQYSEEKKKRDN